MKADPEEEVKDEADGEECKEEDSRGDAGAVAVDGGFNRAGRSDGGAFQRIDHHEGGGIEA